MAIEIQVREPALSAAIIEHVQRILFTRCVPPAIPGLYVDHLDTVPPLELSDPVGDVIKLTLRIAVYVVMGPDLQAHINGVPDGANTPLGAIAVNGELKLAGGRLTLEKLKSDASGVPVPPPAQAAIEAVIDAALAPLNGTLLLDAGPIVTALSDYMPATATLGRGGGVVALRFGATGAVKCELAPNQDWGAFLDSNDMIALLKKRLPNGLPVGIKWLPNGATPGMSLTLNFDVAPLGLEIAGVKAGATVALSFQPAQAGDPARLKLALTWLLDLKGAADLLEPLAQKLARKFLREQLAKVPGAQNDGPFGFYFLIDLPALPPIFEARPVWTGIASDPMGMTLGGILKQAPDAERGILDISIVRFGKPWWIAHCRERARAGDGSPPAQLNETSLKVRAGVGFTDAGALCSFEISPPNPWLLSRADADVTGIGFELPVSIAEKIHSDVQILVRTARGVRLVDLGKPVITRDEKGKVDVQLLWIPDCNFLSGAWLKLAEGERLTKEDFKTPPLEDPNWRVSLGADLGLNVHLVSIEGLEPGEMVEFRAMGVAADVVADGRGRANVPALVGLSGSMHEAAVKRLSQRAFRGTITVETTELMWMAAIGPADAAAVRDVEGRAVIAREINNVLVVETFDPAREEPLARESGETELNPQPLPPNPPPDLIRLAESAGLEEIAGAYGLPGHDQAQVAIVQMRDGTGLVVTADGRRARVSGRFRGPLVGAQIDGDFAILRSGGAVHLFSVARPEARAFEA